VGSSTDRVKPKIIIFVTSQLSTQHYGERAKAWNKDNVSEWEDMSIRELFH